MSDILIDANKFDDMVEALMHHDNSELTRLRSELAAMTTYADKLAAGYPEGMLPKDVEVLREANWNFAAELAAMTAERDAAKWDRDESMLQFDMQQERACKAEARLALAEAVCTIFYDHVHKPEPVNWLAVYQALAAWREASRP